MSIKILVVDDEEDLELLIRQKFREQIRKKEFVFDFAFDGKEALEKIASDPEIGLIFTDINMPVMDGLQLLAELKKVEDRVMKAVVISAYGDMANIRSAMNNGAFDFITKPIDFIDFKTTLNKTIEEREVLLDGIKAQEDLIDARLEKQKSDEARMIQKRFFDNITHELRTPLTLIMGPVEQLIEENVDDTYLSRLHIVDRNSKLLYNLINQLLDFSKIEAGSMSLQLNKADIAHFCSEIVSSFQHLAEDKGLELTFDSDVEEVLMAFDRDKMGKVVYNLLSNAIKFTESGSIVVKLSLIGEDMVNISVRDTGMGIPSEKVPFVFDRFYQVSSPDNNRQNGTGIGLALTRELVELHDGNVSLNSIEGMGSQFIVTIPLRQDFQEDTSAVPVEEITPLQPVFIGKKETPIENDFDTENTEENLVLVIDDNPDIRNFIRFALSPEFKIIEAPNGLAGVQLAKESVPDLIICDVMMPGIEGYEVVERLKDDRSTSHIPIILLTAKAGSESKIRGFKTGADLYLSKPFNTKELMAQIQNLIESRRKLRDSIQTEMLLKPSKPKVMSMEEEFLLKVRETVEANYKNEYYSVEDLAEDMAMSRTQLHRKLVALTAQSASQYVKVYRLDISKSYLESRAGTVADIAFRVGFSSASYFTRCFKDHYGYPPSDLLK